MLFVWKDAETVNHLFLHCPVTDQLWKILSISKLFHGQCLEKLLTFFSAGRKLELGQELGLDGGLFHHVFGGQFGKKGMLDVSRIRVDTGC